MKTWVTSGYTKPAWGKAFLYTNDAGRILWDGTSRFYALQINRERLYRLCVSSNRTPDPGNDKRLDVEELQPHYIGVALASLEIGFNLGILPGINDYK